MAYELLPQGRGVRRIADGALIPDDIENADWQEYQGWLTEGNQPKPAPEPEKPEGPSAE